MWPKFLWTKQNIQRWRNGHVCRLRTNVWCYEIDLWIDKRVGNVDGLNVRLADWLTGWLAMHNVVKCMAWHHHEMYIAVEDLTAIFFYVYFYIVWKRLHWVHYVFDPTNIKNNDTKNNVEQFCDGMQMSLTMNSVCRPRMRM